MANPSSRLFIVRSRELPPAARNGAAEAMTRFTLRPRPPVRKPDA